MPLQGNNLVGKTDGSSGWVGSDLTGTIAQPLNATLAPLGNYGGPTQTMALLPGSPAIGAGVVVSGVTTDQRGLIRGTTVDIGAFQTSLVVESTAGSVVTTAAGLTLPGAVSLADQFAGATISFDPAVFATQQTITLTAQLELSNTALTTSITGPAAGVIISGAGKSRVFQVDSGVTASLTGLTITGGSVSGNGGGLYNAGTTTVTSCAISGNSASSDGGGIANTGALAVAGTTSLTSDSASIGGSIYNSGNLTVTTSGLALAGTLTNAGSVVVDSGVTVYQGSTSLRGLDHQPGGRNLDLQGTAYLDNAYTNGSVYVGGTFTNSGTLEKSTGSGTATLAYALIDTGSIAVDSATFDPTGGVTGTNATITAASGATYVMSGSYAGSFSGSGSGTVQIAGASLGSAGITLDFTGGTLQWSGGSLNGTVTNLGTLTVTASSVALAGTFTNAGSIVVDTTSYFYVTGTYDEDGGTITGPGYINNAAIYINTAPSTPTTIQIENTGNTLETNNLPNVTLWVQGTTYDSNATLNVASGLANDGTILLQSSYNDDTDELNTGSGSFTNDADGTIQVNKGSGAHGRDRRHPGQQGAHQR